uniref:MedDCM-OCT-S28-C46-cds3 n=1 Tax=Candidatus Actinomarina minuta TaxID=1389454 RepID=S5DPV8_9ACTN|nr:MedDCM-OCT-S28-C46-cds3 [Candidatus Actinomarina minuta]
MKTSIIKNFGIGVVLAVVLYTAAFYFQEFNRANEFNEFLEDASTISELHSTNAVNFREILDFSEVDRESFERLLGQIQSNSQESHQLLQNSNIDFTSKEKQLLEIATSSWLDGVELFQVSITTLIDNPSTLKIEESIAQSIVSLAIGDKAYAEFLFLIKQNASIDGTFLPNFYQIEYIGLEDNSYTFADLLVDQAKSSSGGLFLQKNLAITGTEFTPMPITFTEDGAAVLLDEPTALQVVISNEGNVEIYDVVVLVLVTDEYGETVYEFQTKINSVGPKESKIFLSDTINIEKGVVHEWFVKIEEIEKEEELTDNLLSVFGFIPPEG